MKRISLLVLILFQVSILCAFEIKSEVSSEKEIKRRVHLKTDNLNLSAISLKTEEKDYYSLSFTTPWFGFGKLKSKGLFTESLNACSYSPTSEVFFQRGDLVLDTSISDTGKYGMFVNPGENLTFFAFGDEDDWYLRGIKAGFEAGDLSMDLLIENSDASDSGAEMFNAFFNFIYSKECFFLSSCTGCSFGSYIENGIFNRDYVSFFYKNYFELNLMFSGTSIDYLSPCGKVPDSQYKYGADGWVRPFKWIKLSCLCYNDYKRPDSDDELYNDFIKHLDAKITLYLWNLRLTGGCTWEDDFLDTSDTDEKRELDFGVRFDCDWLSLYLTNDYYVKNSVHYRDVWNASAKLYFDPVQLAFTYKRDIQDEVSETFKEEAIIRTYPLYIKFTHKKETDKASEFIVSAALNY